MQARKEHDYSLELSLCSISQELFTLSLKEENTSSKVQEHTRLSTILKRPDL